MNYNHPDDVNCSQCEGGNVTAKKLDEPKYDYGNCSCCKNVINSVDCVCVNQAGIWGDGMTNCIVHKQTDAKKLEELLDKFVWHSAQTNVEARDQIKAMFEELERGYNTANNQCIRLIDEKTEQQKRIEELEGKLLAETETAKRIERVLVENNRKFNEHDRQTEQTIASQKAEIERLRKRNEELGDF